MRYFRVDENALMNLLTNSWKLECLEADGVDNWEWYMESAQEVINNFLEYNIIKDNNEDYDFEDCARYELEHNFEEID